jgi:hypothetical protein
MSDDPIYTTPQTITRFWEDLGFMVRMSTFAVGGTVIRVDFAVYEYRVGGIYGSTTPVIYFFKRGARLPEVVEDRADARVYYYGRIQWDGTMSGVFDPGDEGIIEFSTKQEAMQLGVLMGRLYELAAEMMPQYAESLRCPPT